MARNSVPFKTNHVSKDKYALKCPYAMKPKGITLHNTANDATAENEISYMIRNNSSTGFHRAVDDKEVIEGIPINRNAWANGDGSNGYGNRNHISYEICYSKSGGVRYDRAEANAIMDVAYEMHQQGWDISDIKKHQDWSGKFCPHRILGKTRGWEGILKAIDDELSRLKRKPNNSTTNTSNKPKPKPEAVKPKPKPKPKITVLNADKTMGQQTVYRLQEYYNMPYKDKVISHQWKSKANAGINANAIQYDKTQKGSPLIRKIQADLGVTQDGLLGKLTVKAWQKRYGLIADGEIWKVSALVGEIQRRLNNNKLF